jgi:AcrR family transcriptional regulator
MHAVQSLHDRKPLHEPTQVLQSLHVPPYRAGMESLREREKRQRRQLIADTALQLFADRGYCATTIEDIAAAVGIAPRTFFTHFRSKDDLVFALDEQRYDLLAQRLVDRAPGTDALAVAVQVLQQWLTERGEATDVVRERLLAESPALAARSHTQIARYQALLARAISVDLHVDGDADPESEVDVEMRAAMAAAAALAGWAHTGRRHAAGAITVADVPALLEGAAAFARRGLQLT